MIHILQNSRIYIALSLIVISMVACGPTSEEIAKEKYTRASSLYDQERYNDAMLILDSIANEFSGEIEYVTRAEDLIRKIKISEQERSLAFLDSALSQKNKELEGLMKNFIISKAYGEKEILIHKRQKPENSFGRTYLRAHLDMEGNFYISSRYSGDKYIYHNKIKVYHQDQAVISEEIPYDEFDNRRFEDGGTYWEVVNYKDNADNGIIDFISQNYKLPLKVEFIGKKRYYIVMEKFDKEAIRDGYEISFVLKEITKIKKEIEIAKNQLDRLK
ncbi:hypothetical protein [Plebeiibacterium sediminum]|uniref:Uncharacterized protein n=1 Tax=Plebeiibacterium sediminum TaxID=2992112 RepID=A0AAE3SFQ5_9BACT|nr:hypothetical protein [Plebeiobacterium sediminum]MCW3787693.1 hypothetical protein [Plebeiobacterium sediminum]